MPEGAELPPAGSDPTPPPPFGYQQPTVPGYTGYAPTSAPSYGQQYSAGQAPPFPPAPLPWAPGPPVAKGPNRPGVVSLAFAAVAFLFAVVPPISGFTFVFAITAIVLAIVGLTRKGKRKKAAIAGLIVAVLAWLISIVVFSSFVFANAEESSSVGPGSSKEAPAEDPSAEEEPATIVEDLSAYTEIDARDYALLVKDPDAQVGKNFIVYGSIWQFDSASGKCSFLVATETTAMEDSWEYSTDAMVWGGDGESDCALLDPIIEGDVVKMWVTNMGSYSYDTQIGGNNTVPEFEVKQIEVIS